ncbi:MAG TPA: universal stress protein [Ktedonobacteraceae bacterium]|nr:universal stress protein [Ktedonobacteraceae bacterium]
MMSKRILLGIDSNTSSATWRALRTVAEFIEATPVIEVRLVLIHVIALPNITSHSAGMYGGHLLPFSATLEQRNIAEKVLHQARTALLEEGIEPAQIETMIRVGMPADEIVKAAKELHAHFIAVGSRGESMRHKLRRFFFGSTSRRVLQLAPCPVMIAVVPRMPRSTDLATWYQQTITTHLSEHTDTLTVLTPHEAAQKFLPPNKKSVGRKEIAAATLALEQLTGNGIFCRHDVKGELRYVND